MADRQAKLLTKAGTPRKRAPGAGPKPKAPGQKRVAVSVTVDPDVLAFITAAGDGNVSRGLRTLVRKLMGKGA